MKLSNSNHCPRIKTQKQVEVWAYATSLTSTSRSVCNFLHKQKCMQFPSQAEVYAISFTSRSVCNFLHKQKCMQFPSQAEVYAISFTSGSVCNFLHMQKCMQLPSQEAAEVYVTSLTSTSGSNAASLTNTSGSVCNFLHKHKRDHCMSAD